MKAIEIKKDIYWVGGIDWNVRNFHGYLTQRGSTFNAYLIIDKKITLIDTVKTNFTDEMLKRISSIIDISKIDVIVCNHVEMDHSGALPTVVKHNPNVEIITSNLALNGLKLHYDCENWNFKLVETGDIINIGKRNLHFIQTPMVHWPDNMMEYIPEDKILFSNDSFGQHYASSKRFDDENPLDTVIEEARKYYANIFLCYTEQIKKELQELEKFDVEMIAPSHGIVWRSKVKEIMAEYQNWTQNRVKKKAVIVYDTMWGSTEKMAYSIQDAFEEIGYETFISNLQFIHTSDIMTEIIDAEYICLGSPTLNSDIMPLVASFIVYFRGLVPKNRKSIVFGSFGWGGQGIDKSVKYLQDKINIVEVIKQKFIPQENNLKEIKEKVMSIVKAG